MSSRGLPSLLVRRLAGAAVVVVAVTALSWLLLRWMRPDQFPAQPSWWTQFHEYMTGVFLHREWGESARGEDLTRFVTSGVRADASLLFGGLAVGLLGGFAGGALLAGRGRGRLASAGQFVALAAMAAPVYVTGLMVLLLFGDDIARVDLGFGVPLKYVEFDVSPARWLTSLLAPWLVLGLPLAGVTLRVMYGATREALEDDPVRLARAKGVPERLVLLRHAGPLGAAPALSVVSASANVMVLNMVLLEKVFSVPGTFRLIPQALADGDVNLIVAMSTVAALFVAVTTAFADVLLRRLDPRT